ncbi:MAG: serine protein kinase RIO [Candidatus Micrarchaeota archaeon]|mgnify:CR=1 FL=1
MARRISRRKKPSKEDFVLKPERKIESEVFDRDTLLVLSKMIKKGIIANVDYPISTGKEANIFRATTSSGEFVAVKIYKLETAPFFRKAEYLEGDPRFMGIKGGDRNLVLAFARKEFKNLKICEDEGVHAPRPLYMQRHVLVMSFVGDATGLPFPTLNVFGSKSEDVLNSILEDIKKLYRAGLVHADISEYNIMMSDPPTLIDFGQGVILSHPRAMEFLERDVRNILKYFAKFGCKKDFEKTMEWLKA